MVQKSYTLSNNCIDHVAAFEIQHQEKSLNAVGELLVETYKVTPAEQNFFKERDSASRIFDCVLFVKPLHPQCLVLPGLDSYKFC
jgi:hypothetical protein